MISSFTTSITGRKSAIAYITTEFIPFTSVYIAHTIAGDLLVMDACGGFYAIVFLVITSICIGSF
jgi:hypothetical protein